MGWMGTRTGSRNDGGTDYHFYGADLGITLKSRTVVGHIKLTSLTTNTVLESRGGDERLDQVSGFGFSADQELGKTFAVFTIVGVANDGATALIQKGLCSGGGQVNESA